MERINQRKDSHKLPEARAFWELIRIVFIETPRSFTDVILFAMAKLAIFTALRAGENAIIPADWERWREYFDTEGRPAGERGGISRSLMLRYFAEKQNDDEDGQGIVLVPRIQHIPPMFEDLVLETLSDIARITEPLRERLRRQTKSGRVFPEFAADELVPAIEMYNRVAGSLQLSKMPIPEDVVRRYRSNYDATVLEEIRAQQMATIAPHMSHDPRVKGRHNTNVSERIGAYWHSQARTGLLILRNACGNPLPDEPMDFRGVYLRVAEVEEWLPIHNPRKMPDVVPFRVAGGTLVYPSDMLFLVPQFLPERSKHGRVTDVTRYCGPGRLDNAALTEALGGSRPDLSLFARYGETEEDRGLTLSSHALRHLQHTELFRLGVADTIITKRFNRRSVAQSYEYDHRSLAEQLDAIEIPEAAKEILGPRAQETYRLIASGKVSGPIVDEFRRIQHELGDDAAFEYLDAEADGLHVTPYGFCLNSFMVNPCPKHLECFNGCRHLARTDLPEEQRTLERLRDRLRRGIASIEARPSNTLGWRNQLSHGRQRLANVEKALVSSPGSKPFPDGPDLYRSIEDGLGATLLDRRTVGV